MTEAVAVHSVQGNPVPETGTYQIDPSHCTIELVVRHTGHMGLAAVRGRFNQLDGTIDVGEDITASSARVTIAAQSIDTQDASRDAHRRATPVAASRLGVHASVRRSPVTT